MYLFVLEGLGTTELLAILVVALIIFGPRKLPELSRKLGKSISEFRRASEDFKRTWEREAALDEVTPKAGEPMPTVMPPTVAPSEFSIGRGAPTAIPEPIPEPSTLAETVTDVAPLSSEETVPAPVAEPAVSSKRDWL